MSPIPGAADLEHKNAYWIDFGKREEQERIIKLLEDNKGQKGLISVEYAQWLIKGENK